MRSHFVLALTAAAALSCATSATAQRPPPFAGTYMCMAAHKAGIGRTHLEGDPGPQAFVGAAGNRFRIEVVAERDGHIVRELPYDGPDRDPSEWHTRNSVLHSDYYGEDGEDDTISAVQDQGFLRFGYVDRASGALWFYHAGFEYPGGEDTNLSIRYGTCERETPSH